MLHLPRRVVFSSYTFRIKGPILTSLVSHPSHKCREPPGDDRVLLEHLEIRSCALPTHAFCVTGSSADLAAFGEGR
jgi:hypothetical protein